MLEQEQAQIDNSLAPTHVRRCPGRDVSVAAHTVGQQTENYLSSAAQLLSCHGPGELSDTLCDIQEGCLHNNPLRTYNGHGIVGGYARG